MKIHNAFFLNICLAALLCVVPAFAADDGCSNENNDAIVADLALCTTHIFNVGLVSNPDDAATRELMKEAVALKATIMTQQMKKQYDYLEATVRRLKTQLQKATLLSQLQAAGAADTSTSGGASVNINNQDKNIRLAGAENCTLKNSMPDVISCLQSNLNIIVTAATSNNNYTQAKKQLEIDLKIATRWKIVETDDKGNIKDKDCKELQSNKASINNCAGAFRQSLSVALDEWRNKNVRYPQQGYGYY